jgi:uncharacterized membrane protein YdbT with pleckstrin-like domain
MTDTTTDAILYRANPPMFRNHPLLFIGAILLIAAFGLGILILLYWFVMSKAETLTITNGEIRYEKGILSKTRKEIRLPSIRSVRVHQSFAQRIFGTGDIEIYSAGDQPEIVAKGMPDPHRIRELT